MIPKELIERLTAEGYSFPPLACDGIVVRGDRGGKCGNAWFIGRTLGHNGTSIYTATYGDWAMGEKGTYKSTGDLSPIEEAEVSRLLKEAHEKAIEEKRRGQEETKLRCQKQWAEASVHGESPYLKRKGLSELHGCRLDISSPRAIQHGVQTLVPMRDINGVLSSLQSIGEDGFKSFAPGGRVRGLFHALGELRGDGTVYIAEGIATAASVAMATDGACAVAAFTASNLMPVAKELAARYPSLRILLCGDNDCATKRPDGTPFNPGVSAAREAAAAVGGTYIVPACPDGVPRDFNDLHQAEGLARVRAHIEEGSARHDAGAAIALHDAGEAEGGKKRGPSEKELALAILRHHAGRLVRQRDDLFAYNGTRWARLESVDIDRLKSAINELRGGGMRQRDMQSAYRTLLQYADSVPSGVDLYTPNPFCANFKNGTLHAVQKKEGRRLTYSTEFRPHSPTDYLINTLPYVYDPDRRATNALLQEELSRWFEGESDEQEKIDAIQEMYGACLLPLMPHLFMLHGPPRTGKSTAIHLAALLVAEENRCGVQPAQFVRFNMDIMVGKLLNYDADIDTTRPIADTIVKKIIDRVPIRIERKGLRDITAPLPSVHIFGGNRVPPTIEGATGAHDRRWSFIKFTKEVKGEEILFYWQRIWEESPDGLLNWALAGLDRLLAKGGLFTNPTSGKAAVSAWQGSQDTVFLFLQDVGEGEIGDGNSQLMRGSGLKIARKNLFEIFRAWEQQCGSGCTKTGKHAFFTRLRELGIKEYASDGVRYFQDLGLELTPSVRF